MQKLSSDQLATDDYEIFEGERRVGRIYKLTFPTSEQWYWQVYPERGGHGGQDGKADGVVEAGMAFRKALEAQRR